MKPLLPARSGAWRRLVSAPLLITLGACATYYDDPTHHQSAAETSGGAAGNGGNESAGAAPSSTVAGGGSGAGAGSTSSGGGLMGGAGASLGGGAGAGGLAAAGSAGSAGVATGGVGGGSGAGGAGGGNAGGGAGGKAGGVGGASGGNGGSGGAGQPRCDDHPLTAKSKWVVSASSSDGPAPPAQAVDGDVATRWTTGKEQVGGEWLQIDFGATVSLTQLTLVLGSSANDYPRKYATRFSNSSQNTAAAVLLSGTGAPSSDTVMNFSKVSSGRYLLITQGGTAPALWWSVAEIQAQCAD